MNIWNWLRNLFTKQPAPSPVSPPAAMPVPEHAKDGALQQVMVAFNAPWVIANYDMLGKEESDPALNARFVPGWKLVGLNFTTLSGSDHAWCAERMEVDLHKVGLKGTGSAAAISYRKFGKACGYVFGAILPIEHQSGGHHVCNFLYWIDEARQLACTLDGNKSNRYAVNVTDLSIRGDKVIPSPRWPLNHPDGMFVSKADVLAKYPFLAVHGSAGGGTR